MRNASLRVAEAARNIADRLFVSFQSALREESRKPPGEARGRGTCALEPLEQRNYFTFSLVAVPDSNMELYVASEAITSTAGASLEEVPALGSGASQLLGGGADGLTLVSKPDFSDDGNADIVAAATYQNDYSPYGGLLFAEVSGNSDISYESGVGPTFSYGDYPVAEPLNFTTSEPSAEAMHSAGPSDGDFTSYLAATPTVDTGGTQIEVVNQDADTFDDDTDRGFPGADIGYEITSDGQPLQQPTLCSATSAPVYYSTGGAAMSSNDFISDGAHGVASSLNLSWSNVSYSAGSQAASFGNGMSFDGLSYLAPLYSSETSAWPGGNAFVVVSQGQAHGVFQDYSGKYFSTGNAEEARDVYTTDLAGHIIETQPDGTRTEFYGLSGATAGKMISRTSPAGDQMAVNWDSTDSVPSSIDYTYANHSGSTTTEVDENFAFTYATGTNQVIRVVQSKNGVAVRTVDYSYYGSGDSNGNSGDLQYVTMRNGDESSPIVNTNYYRWYTADSSTGYVGGLKFFVGDEAFEKATHDNGVTNLDSISDATLQNYADNYFEYDTNGTVHRVTKEIALQSGAGCSCGKTGEGTYTFTYADNTSDTKSAGRNTWQTQTTVTLPDGDQNIVYTNAFGDEIFKIVDDVASGTDTYTWNQYDTAGNIIRTATGNEITGYSTDFDDLVGYGQSGTYLASTGRIDVNNYYTAQDGVDASLIGYQKSTGYQQGPDGTFIPTESWTYTNDGTGDGVWDVATDTTYPDASDLTDTRVTTYTYDSWWQIDGVNTSQPMEVTTSMPEVDAAQNGPDSSSDGSSSLDQTETYYDSAGRVVWSVDASGYINYYQYDPLTGAQTEEIDDVDPSTITTAAVAGPTRSSSLPAALNLTTTTVVDAQGQPIKVTDPNGNVTYTVYDDTTADGDPRKVITYSGWNAATDEPTGPITAVLDDPATGITDTISYTWTGGVPVDADGVPTGAELSAANYGSSHFTLLTLTRQIHNVSNQLVESERYFNLSGISYVPGTSGWDSLGTAGTNYYATKYKYDSGARLYQTTDPTGTITMQVLDARGLAISTWIGTNNTDATDTDPTGGGAAGNNMIQTEADTYDADGNLIEQEKLPGGSATPRVTLNYYDWRDRLIASKSGVLLNSDGSEDLSAEASGSAPISYTIYDNLDEPIEQDSYDGAGVAISSTDGVPSALSASLLRASEGTDYDAQGRVYRTSVFSVNPINGDISSDSIDTNTWYDLRGNVIKTQTSGQAATKTAYDGDDRPIIVYTTDSDDDAAAGSSGNWSNASNVSGDTVLEQDEYTYDGDGNVIETIKRDRLDTDTGTGALGTPTTGNEAAVYYSTSYFDAADRDTADVNVGTNGGSAYTRPSSVPSRSDSVLVSSTTYNPAGWVDETTDPNGNITKTDYDSAGQTVATIGDYGDSDHINQTTEYTYDGEGHVLTMTAVQTPGEPNETTQYIYGVTTAGGSGIDSNDLLAATDYPDLNTGAASSSQRESFTYNALGEKTSYTDRDGDVHAYSYDVMGRQTLDAVTTLGSGVDGTIRAIGTQFNSQGLAYLDTSYSNAAATTVANQVEDIYNGLGQLTGEYQAHTGAVNTSTTPEVQYGYSSLANGSRQSDIIYPNGREIVYNYSSGVNADISRISSLSDSSGTLQSYEYQGTDTPMVTTDGNGVELDVTLDDFGRTSEQNWLSGGYSSLSYSYDYDADGNITLKINSYGGGVAEHFGYDGLNRLDSFNDGFTSSTGAALTLDDLGNITDRYNGPEYYDDAPKSSNAQNEFVNVNENDGISNDTYDANGNTTVDQQDFTTNSAGTNYTVTDSTYDAWNRLISASGSNYPTGVAGTAGYSYDALGRRIVETDNGTTTDVYFSNRGQAIEERQAGATTTQYLWGPFYVNQLVERDDQPDSSGVLTERLYVEQDTNYDVIALTDSYGDVAQQYQYDGYGVPSLVYGSPTGSPISEDEFGMQYLFQGGRYDAVTGFYHFGTRDYDPVNEVWLQQDPAGYPDGANRYEMEGDDPTTNVDPSGLRGTLVAPPRSSSIWARIGSGIETAFDDIGWLGGEIGEAFTIDLSIPASMGNEVVYPPQPGTGGTGSCPPANPTAPSNPLDPCDDPPPDPSGQIENNHVFPQALSGGDFGPTTPMSFSQHRGPGASFHNDLNEWLEQYQTETGESMRPGKGNSGDAIRDNFTADEIINAMKEFYDGPCGDKWPDQRDAFYQYMADQGMSP